MPIPQFNNRRSEQSWRSSTSSKKRKPATYSRNIQRYNDPNDFKSKIKAFLIKVFLFCFVVGSISSLLFIAWVTKDLPDPNQLLDREVAQSTKIYDRTGEELLYEIHGEEKRTLVTIDEIPDHVEWAVIAMEDKNFYNHPGFSITGIIRAVIKRKGGASTLTQQFIKNAILTNERSYIRKLKEVILASKLEKRFSKDEILQMYLNEIPYGSNAYGVEAASQKYFGKSIKEVNIAEAAILSSIIQAPTRYSPYGSHKDILIGRQQYVIDLMEEQGYISPEQAEEAKNFELVFAEQKSNLQAPHFVMYVKELLSGKYGEKRVEQGGLKIITTLDLYKQKIAEEVVKEKAEKNTENYDATNAALVSIDPKTGQVLAMVGSKDYFSKEIDGQVNIATRPRQPGSSLKPLVFAAAFEKGYTPDTILYDVVTNFSHDKEKKYEPKNYNLKEFGPVSIRKALAGSLNIPAVKALYLVGVNNVLELADKFGYETLKEKDRFGLSLVLGGGEVQMLEHVNAYGVFAREGRFHPTVAVLRVEDSEGEVLEEYEEKEEEVIDGEICRQINDILSDNDARAYAFGTKNWLNLGARPVAAKTGTTNGYKDAWTIGYTPSLVTGVWVGKNDATEMKMGAAGGVVAAPIWHDYMKKVLGNTPVEQFKKPSGKKTGKPVLDGEITGGTTYKIDKVTGLLATEFTPQELIVEKKFFNPHSILYYVDKNDPQGDAPKDPSQDSQFELWESRILEWAEKQVASSTDGAISAPPTEYDNVHKQENLPTLEIVKPIKNETIAKKILETKIRTSAPRGVAKVDYYINNILFKSVTNYPFELESDISFLNNGFHNLKIVVCDDVNNCFDKDLEFNLKLKNNKVERDIGLDLISPSSGLAASNIDFPLGLEFNVTNPEATAKINFYMKDETGKVKLIKKIESINKSIITSHWTSVPESGTYKVYGQAISWGGQKVNSKEHVIIVNNLLTPPKTEDPETE